MNDLRDCLDLQYNQDGDQIDNRNQIIQSLRSHIEGTERDMRIEKEKRERSPALKAAWEQYHVLLRLTDETKSK